MRFSGPGAEGSSQHFSLRNEGAADCIGIAMCGAGICPSVPTVRSDSRGVWSSTDLRLEGSFFEGFVEGSDVGGALDAFAVH